MKSAISKRSIVISGHKTSLSLEDEFWKSLKEIAVTQTRTLSNPVAHIESQRTNANLSSCIRLFVLNYYRSGAIRNATDQSCVISENSRDHVAKEDQPRYWPRVTN
jgi:predicted DNA-binding ribbon-helix-helix protein